MTWLNVHLAKNIAACFEGKGESFLTELIASAREGHLCLLKKDPLDLPPAMVYDDPGALETIFPLQPVVRKENLYYLQRNWVYETLICREILRLSSHFIPDIPSYEEPNLLPAQKKAAMHALSHQLTIISGGPGTGKTYTAGRLIRALCQTSDVKRLYKVCLTAPTGRAAQHLQSAFRGSDLPIALQTDTLHCLLKLSPGQSKLFRPHPIDADVIIVDEASMIDVDLWAHLLQAVQGSTKLIILGDPDQLPPVEAGSVFADLSEKMGIPLDRCMRTDQIELQHLSAMIRKGSFADVYPLLESSFGLFSLPTPESLYETLALPVFSSLPDPKICLESFQRCKLLSALRQGPLGVDAINDLSWRLYRKTFQPGHFWAAPILIASNHSRLGLYNGSLGVLIGRCEKSKEEAIAYFLDPITHEMRSFSPRTLPHHEWAFCLSVHKSQGGEFDEVFAVFPEGSERFGKEALYTAATRAKKQLRFAILPQVLKGALEKCCRKHSGILQRLG